MAGNPHRRSVLALVGALAADSLIPKTAAMAQEPTRGSQTVEVTGSVAARLRELIGSEDDPPTNKLPVTISMDDCGTLSVTSKSDPSYHGNDPTAETINHHTLTRFPDGTIQIKDTYPNLGNSERTATLRPNSNTIIIEGDPIKLSDGSSIGGYYNDAKGLRKHVAPIFAEAAKHVRPGPFCTSQLGTRDYSYG